MDKTKKKFLIPLGQRVENIRMQLDITQKKMAEILGLSEGYLSSIIKGKYSPTFIFYHNMAKKLNVKFDYLFFGTGKIFKTKKHDLQDQNLDFIVSQQQFGQDTPAIKELLWYMEHSPMIRNTVMGEFKLFLYEKENSIKKDIKKHKKIMDQKKENHDDQS